MLRSLSLMALALWAGGVSAAPRVTWYNAECHACGEKRVDMGSHSFCALSYVHSGGFNSYCAVGGNPKSSWWLLAKDPDGGETQACGAVCMDLEGSTGGADPVVAPPSPPPVSRPAPPPAPRPDPAPGGVPDTFGPYQSTFGTLTMQRSGNRVTGTYTHKGGRVEGTLSGNTLTGRWTQTNGEGRMVFRFNSDFSGFTGVWSYGDAVPNQEWNGRR